MLPRYPTRFFASFGLGLSLVLGSAGLALATTLLLFMATYDGSAVRVEWAVRTETDVRGFDLSRKLPTDSVYHDLSRVAPTGKLRYAFADTCLTTGCSGLLQGPISYRLTVTAPAPTKPTPPPSPAS